MNELQQGMSRPALQKNLSHHVLFATTKMAPKLVIFALAADVFLPIPNGVTNTFAGAILNQFKQADAQADR